MGLGGVVQSRQRVSAVHLVRTPSLMRRESFVMMLSCRVPGSSLSRDSCGPALVLMRNHDYNDCPHEHDGYDPSYIMEFRMLVRGSCIRCKGTVWPDVSRHDLP